MEEVGAFFLDVVHIIDDMLILRGSRSSVLQHSKIQFCKTELFVA